MMLYSLLLSFNFSKGQLLSLVYIGRHEKSGPPTFNGGTIEISPFKKRYCKDH